MSVELVGREPSCDALVRPARRRRGWSRSSGPAASARRPSRSRPAGRRSSRAMSGGWRLVGAARVRDDSRRGRRRADRGVERHRRRGRAVRAAQGPRRAGDPRQLRARHRCGRGARRPPARRRARAADPVHQPGPARRRRRDAVRARTARAADAVELFTRRASRAAQEPARRRGRRRGARPLPFARRAAARDRTRRGAHQDAVDRGDHPPPRRPLQRVERPDEPQAGTPPRAQGDDRVELRAVVPRRPARPVGARDVRRWRSAAGGRVRARSTRRAGDPRRSTWSAAREPVARHRRRRGPVAARSLPTARQHPCVRARSDAAEAGARPTARSLRTREWFADAAAIVDRRVCAAAARPSISPSPEPSGPTSTPRWRGARRTTRRSRSTSSTDSGGRGSCSATAAARNGSSPRSTRPATRAPIATEPIALLLAAWIEASTGDLELARDHVAQAAEVADAIDDVDLQARCCYYLAYVVSHTASSARALELTDRSRRAVRRAGPAVGPGRELAVRRPRRDLRRRRGAQRRSTRPGRALAGDVDDPWLHVRRDAMLGELARLQHRFDDAVAAHRSRRRDVATARLPARPRRTRSSSLGRAQCQAGDYDDRRRHARARDREGRGDRRRSTGCARPGALGRVLARARARPSDARAALEAASAWHRAVGGGEQDALGECLLAAMDASRRVPGAERPARRDPRRGPAQRRCPRRGLRPRRARPASRPRPATSTRARTLRDAADDRLDAASHFITERDRVDAHACGRPPDRQSVAPEPSPASVISRSCSALRRPVPALVEQDEREQSARHDRDADELTPHEFLAQEQERPHDRQRRLRDLGDADRADRDRLLRVDVPARARRGR